MFASDPRPGEALGCTAACVLQYSAKASGLNAVLIVFYLNDHNNDPNEYLMIQPDEPE